MSTTGIPVRIEAAGNELTAGPAFDDWHGDWWLAEELLVAAVGASLLDAFRARARDERLALGAIRCTGEAELGGRLNRIVLRVELEAAADDLARAAAALRAARESAALPRALAVELELQITPIPSTVAVAMIEPA